MKKLLIAAAGLMTVALSAPASAADLAARPYTKAPPPIAAPIYDWTGFYIGANGGWGESRGCVDFVTLAGTVAGGCASRSGGLVGGQIGYRWQSNQFVFGLEAQGDWADIKNTRVSLIDPLLSTTGKTDGIGLFTAQLGWAWNASLLYVKGGAAVTHNRLDVFNNLTGVGLDSASHTRWGEPWASAGSMASRRTGRSVSNTTTSGWGMTIAPSQAQAWSRPVALPSWVTGLAGMWTWSLFG
jgi:outer membrane immunogenic protein